MPRGAVVSGAKVTLTGLGTNVQTSALTNDQGNFSFPDIRGGDYSVEASFKGFRIAKSNTLLLRVGDRLRMDLTLQPGDITETVNVEGAVAPLLETDTSTRGQVIQSQQIEELPLNKRDYSQLVLVGSRHHLQSRPAAGRGDQRQWQSDFAERLSARRRG